MKLLSSLVKIDELPQADRLEMFVLMQVCYANVSWNAFNDDLDAKWLVIQVREPESQNLVGFSTQVMMHANVNDISVHALYSGDTVMHPTYWGDPALAHQWGQLALKLIDEYHMAPLYWFLTSKGFRTYRYLPLFFREYYPKCGGSIPEHESAIIDALGQLVADIRYDPVCQVIRATANKDFVRRGVSEPGLRAKSDPHVRMFIERNPSYHRGDELCCLAPLSRDNFTRAAYRVLNARTLEHEAI
jgi:hypothetical protein